MLNTTELVIAADHPAFDGHFPGTPILPAVVLLDAALHTISRVHEPAAVQWQVLNAKFHSVVRPGDALILEHESLSNGTVRFAIHAGARPSSQAIASGLLKAALPQAPDDAERAR